MAEERSPRMHAHLFDDIDGARREQPVDPMVAEDATSAEHYELVSLLYRSLQCVDHCERAIVVANRSSDYDLALLLEDVLSDANKRVRLLREALGSRVPAAAKVEAARVGAPTARSSDIREIAPREHDTWPAVTPSNEAPSSWSRVREIHGDKAPLIVHLEGRWFRLPTGQRVECGERRVVRRLLARLAQERFHRPGEPVSVEALLHAGWPGEPMSNESGRNRLRVAMVRIRRLGLYAFLRSHHGGYLLDPHVPLRITAGECAA